jgi:protein involved in polysaccharide export with SLBB domain
MVLADGTITLPILGQVPAANLSLAELGEDLKERYGAHYAKKLNLGKYESDVFVSFADTSTKD